MHAEDLPELWASLRLLSHTLKAALETAFVDEHLARVRGWLYVGDPQVDARRPWANGPGARRIVPLPLSLSHFSPDRARAYFVSHVHRSDPALRFSPGFADCDDNTVVAEWLRSARGIPPLGVGAGPTEGRLRLTIGPDCAWTHWKHHVIGSDGFVVESRNITFEDGEGERKGEAARAIGLQVDRAKCEVSLEWKTLVSCVFARPRKVFGEELQKDFVTG